MGARRPRYVNVLDLVRAMRPDITDPIAAIEERRLLVDGRVVTNPRSLVATNASVVVRRPRRLRGEAKLEASLDGFGLTVAARTCLDLGASAGGFTRVLLERGAAQIFAVDAGHGQLREDLCADPHVVNLERTNLGNVRRAIPPNVTIDVVTIDLSYLSLADAVPQLEAVRFAPDADLIGLVKPMFELHLASPPTDEDELRLALDRAVHGIERDRRWRVVGTMPSPVLGRKGAQEWLIHAHRQP